MHDTPLDESLIVALLEHTLAAGGTATQASLLEECARTLERPRLTRAELERALVPMLAAHWIHAVAWNVRSQGEPVRYYVTPGGRVELELRKPRGTA